MSKTAVLSLLIVPLAGLGIVGSAALAANRSTDVVTPVPAQSAQVVQPTVDAPQVKEAPDTEVPDAIEQKSNTNILISAQTATKNAEAKLGKTATSVHLEDQDGTQVYNVVIGDKEVKVSAQNGSILTIETSDNGKEGADAKVGPTSTTEHNDNRSTSDGDGEVAGQ